MSAQSDEYAWAADLLLTLANRVEDAALERDLPPHAVATEAGVSIATVLALHDGNDIALKSAARLVRWLGTNPPPPATWADEPSTPPAQRGEVSP